ncbi:MAG: GatB/YqeY domain-containing protein [Deltaproteobacteria bacterium]|nr:GatB/YqeY domain-containing protein [Deltaproteobacteria bacterium]
MSIENEILEKMKVAMREKQTRELSVLRMVKSFAMKEKTAPGFDGNTGDAFWLDIIARYVKQQQKVLVEFEKVGADKEKTDEIQFEIDYLTPFLPARLSEEETEALVADAIAATGADSMRMMGKVMGVIMKDHKDVVDAAVVKKLIEKKLS